MNVGYKDINCEDAAKIIGVDKTTVRGWCKNNLINYTDISNKGSKKGRYQISESEAHHIAQLVREHGPRKAMMYYEKDWEMVLKEPKINESETKLIDASILNTSGRLEDCLPGIGTVETSEKISEDAFKKAATTKFNPDKILNTISYIQDIKERLEDLEAERNQLLNELAELKQEVMSVIDY